MSRSNNDDPRDVNVRKHMKSDLFSKERSLERLAALLPELTRLSEEIPLHAKSAETPHWYAAIANPKDDVHPVDETFHRLWRASRLYARESALVALECAFHHLIPTVIAAVAREMEPVRTMIAGYKHHRWFDMGVEFGRAVENMRSEHGVSVSVETPGTLSTESRRWVFLAAARGMSD